MTQAQVSYTDSCPLVLRHPVTGSLESLRLSSDVMIMECLTKNGHAAGVNDTAQDSHKMSGGSESPMFP